MRGVDNKRPCCVHAEQVHAELFATAVHEHGDRGRQRKHDDPLDGSSSVSPWHSPIRKADRLANATSIGSIAGGGWLPIDVMHGSTSAAVGNGGELVMQNAQHHLGHDQQHDRYLQQFGATA